MRDINSTAINNSTKENTTSSASLEDPNYASPKGLVTLLLLNSQGTGSRGEYLQQAQKSFITSRAPALDINWRVFPETDGYDSYLSQLKLSCSAKSSGLFDVVMIENTKVGDLSDCLIDLSKYDPQLTAGFHPIAIKNSIFNGSLSEY